VKPLRTLVGDQAASEFEQNVKGNENSDDPLVALDVLLELTRRLVANQGAQRLHCVEEVRDLGELPGKMANRL
jgi:hypothetical protein